jgi:hypothetical protein
MEQTPIENETESLDTEARLTPLLGPHLAKSVVDQFSYALGTRDGSVYRYGEAELHGDWLLLHSCPSVHYEHEPRAVLYFPPGSWRGPLEDIEEEQGILLCRGVQVRLSDVVWVADAPEGS